MNCCQVEYILIGLTFERELKKLNSNPVAFGSEAREQKLKSARRKPKARGTLGTLLRIGHCAGTIYSGVDRLWADLANNWMKELHNVEPLAPGTVRDEELVLELADFAGHPVHKVPTYYFRMVHAGTGEELGAINLRVGSTAHVELYAGHVGYTVHSAHRGHRYAARSLRLLMPLASKLGLNPLWITCDPDNLASQRSCELAGAQFVQVVDVPEGCVIHRSGHRQKYRYRLDITP